MKKQSTTLGQYFKNLVSQVMRSDSSSESNIASDEKPSLKNRLAKHLVAGAAAVAMAAGASSDAKAAVVYWNYNRTIGANVDGLYVNVETGVTYDSANANTVFPGWDINPYGSSALSFFWSPTSNGASAGVRLNTVAGGTTSGTTCASLPIGFVVGSQLVGGTSGASFGTGSAVFTGTNQGKWTLNSDNYFGFRFTASDGLIHYGWGRIYVGASATIRTMLSVAYETVPGASITVGIGDPTPACTLPTLSATTVSTTCAGQSNGSIDLTVTGGTPTPLSYAWTVSGSNTVIATTEDISGKAAGNYVVKVMTATGGCYALGNYTIASGPAITNNTTTQSACDSYTWSLNGTTYTQSGSYTYSSGCNNETLNLTITPSTSNTTTTSAIDTYTWSVNSQTYTQSGTYTSVTGCNTEILNLTITPSVITSNITSCGDYTWSVDGNTYTQSGTYTATSGGTNYALNLTVNTPPAIPTNLACYETANFNSNTCSWDVTGTQPLQPTLACYETASFNTNTCSWDVTGSQPTQPGSAVNINVTYTGQCGFLSGTYVNSGLLNGYYDFQYNSVGNIFHISYNGTEWVLWTGNIINTGFMSSSSPSNGLYPPTTGWVPTQCNNGDLTWSFASPLLACYQTATFNSTTCQWDVTGTQPVQPTLACYQSASFNTTTCQWDVTGTQPSAPTGLACYQTATFNNTTCSWDVTGSQPTMPSLACYETASFNSSTCVWDVTGTQPTMPTLACYETASFNTSSCAWDVSGTQPTVSTGLACYETATFNTSTCVWDVTGSQPTMPSLACYETASFNTTSCSWDVTGTQPSMPTLACYETASFNNTTCSWDVTGSAAAAIVTNATSCGAYTWAANGQAYTQSGTYTYYANCQDYTLNLSAAPSTTYYADMDGDGYGNVNVTTTSCNGAPAGYVSQGGDCYDNSATAYPGATEICNNGIDDNCDGNIDEGTSVSTNPISGSMSVCTLYPGAKILTTTPVQGVSTYNWTVPADLTITAGQGTTSITVYWGNVNLLANGILGDVTVTAMGTPTGCGTLIPAKLPVDIQYTAPVTPPSISGPSAICPTESGVYSIALVKRASSYEWSVPTGATINSGNGSNIINVSYANGFTGGNITVGARNVCGLSTPLRSRTVTLNTLPAPAAITGPIDGLCNASNANYLATAVVGATGYNWTVPSNASVNGASNSNNISANFNSSFTTGNITVAAVNNCGVGATRSLAVKAAPATPGSITGPATACAGSTQSYSISTIQGASNYTWTVPGGAVINSGQGSKNLNITHSTNASTSGIITVKSSNTCGTSSAKVLAVTTTVCPRLGDATTQLEVYPNPASSYINVSFNVEQSQQATIILRDAAGRVVYNEAIDAATGLNNQQIELSNLAKGVYFVQLQTSDSSENTRLIVE